MGKFLKREKSYPGRFAKKFRWKILRAAVSAGDAFEIMCIPGRECGHYRAGPRGLAMPGFGRTTLGHALMVSGVG
jgi:hypothetical protein